MNAFLNNNTSEKDVNINISTGMFSNTGTQIAKYIV